MKIRSLILTLNILAVLACNSVTGQQKLNVTEFEQKLNSSKSAQVLDVRTPDEYNNGHLAKAININWNGNDFEAAASKLDKSKPVFVYCLGGGRSANASAKLKSMGFTEIYDMQGGITAWNNASKPLEGVDKNASKGMDLDEYNKKINSDKLALVDFNAPWCGPCQKMAPMLEEVAKEYSETLSFIKINVDENKDLIKSLQIDGPPVLIIYRNGKEIWKHTGIIEKAELIKEIK